MDISRGLVTNVLSLLCVFSYAVALNWDVDAIENLVGKIPATLYESSSPINRVYSEQELKHCEALLGRWSEGVYQHPPYDDYNLTEILINLGGYPGKVNVERRTNVPVAILIDTDPHERPLPDPPRKYWLYEYNSTDYASYIRLEHASNRLPGTPKEFVDIRGKLVWTPPDFCGKMRLVLYRLDDTGLHFEIRPSVLEFRNNGTELAIRHAPVCLQGLDGKAKCIS